MKRVVLTLAVATAAAFATPAVWADPQVRSCGITPRIPCGVCLDAHTCVSLDDIER